METQQEQQQDWRQEPWVDKVSLAIGIAAAAYGGYRLGEGGKGIVAGLVFIAWAAHAVGMVPDRFRGRYLLAVVAVVTPILVVDIIWEPWSW
jgi:hypothetical protein